MYLSWRRKRALSIFGFFIVIAIVFFTLWFLQPPQVVSQGEFRVIGTPTPTPSLTPTPKRTPVETPVISTPSPIPTQAPTPMDVTGELMRLCRKGLDSSLCVSRVALALGKPELCEQTSLKGRCYYIIATELRNSAICKKSNDPITCSAVVGESPALCEDKKDEELRGLCYHAVAVASRDAALCEKADLVGTCYQEVAIASNNAQLCEKGTDKAECEAVIEKKPSLCESAYAPAPCYGRLALLLNDVSLVEKAGSDSDYYYRIAFDTNNIALCENAMDSFKCKAVLERNEELCKKASNRRACYGDLAVAMAEDEALKKK